jgi:lipopolysaccharide/colanic/teichoic acid biosynthesis glycosyltransferase/dTDP-glucose pyrophosphorylase
MGTFLPNPRLRKVVILAGGQKNRLYPLAHFFAPCLLPVLNRPLITYTLDFLKKSGIEEIMLSISEYNEAYDLIKKEYASDLRIDYHIEDKPRGTAGALKDVEDFIGDEVFGVVIGSVLIEDIDLNKALDHFYGTGSTGLAGVYKLISPVNYLESVKVKDGIIEGIFTTPASADARSPWRTSGIYIFHPRVLSMINRRVYMDLKEQLIPAMKREALKVSAYEIEGCYKTVSSLNDYFMLQRDILHNLHSRTYYWPIGDKTEIADRVWIGKNAVISPTAYLLGPVVIGDDCKIENWAQIIGPAVVGNGCRISSGVLFRESILHDNVSLSRNSKIDHSIIFEGSQVSEDLDIRSTLVTNGMESIYANLVPSDYTIKDLSALSSLTSVTRTNQAVFRAVKRCLDLIIASVSLFFLSPFFLAIGSLIKADSAGPVFYGQKRCGKNGKLFKMLKFRTMVENAEKMHKTLLSEKDTDGPMFKMFNDPRITRIGSFLRKTSLDEMPQLLNVIKGEMSLVGPRPLIMDEMKFSQSWRDMRLKVKPGITGLWQVQGRSEASFHDWIIYDVYYVKSQSLLLDISILFKTIRVVLKKTGSY